MYYCTTVRNQVKAFMLFAIVLIAVVSCSSDDAKTTNTDFDGIELVASFEATDCDVLLSSTGTISTRIVYEVETTLDPASDLSQGVNAFRNKGISPDGILTLNKPHGYLATKSYNTPDIRRVKSSEVCLC